ncbi:MAG: MFS transporter [Microthrixaceae bacterium]|nr:MFS transporter [Microthrixaceae bacterium]
MTPPSADTDPHPSHDGAHRWAGAELPTEVKDPTAWSEPTLRLRADRGPQPASGNEDGDTKRHGTVAAALGHQQFRRVAAGAFASNIGTWMQNVTLIALANNLTHSGAFVGLVTFAQLGPMLVASPVGGVLADRFDRRRIIMTGSAVQGVLSIVLAIVAWNGSPPPWALVLIVLGIGLANALVAPSNGALLPHLVDRRDLSGAVAVNSASMNGSRVLGPLLAALTSSLGTGWIFLINAATYLFVIAAVAAAKVVLPEPDTATVGPWQRFADGFNTARRNPVLRRVLTIISAFSLCSLVFIYQLPGLADDQLGITGSAFYRLFAAFGLGAAGGAIVLGTLFGGRTLDRVPLFTLPAFAAALTAFALNHNPLAAHFIIFVLGFFYFTLVTALSTTLQEEVDDAHRGRVMGLWMICWAGLVPVGSLLAGPVIDQVGGTPVLLFGAAVALGLTTIGNLDRNPLVAPLVAPDAPAPQPGCP